MFWLRRQERPPGRAWESGCPCTWVFLSVSHVSLVPPSVFLPSSLLYAETSQNGVDSEMFFRAIEWLYPWPCEEGGSVCALLARDGDPCLAGHSHAAPTHGVPLWGSCCQDAYTEDQCPLPLYPRPHAPPYYSTKPPCCVYSMCLCRGRLRKAARRQVHGLVSACFSVLFRSWYTRPPFHHLTAHHISQLEHTPTHPSQCVLFSAVLLCLLFFL